MAGYTGSGLTDKLYWRPRSSGTWHCFTKQDFPPGHPHRYISLCGKYTRRRSSGQASARPPSIRRCPRCDGHEIKRREWDEGGRTNPAWEAHKDSLP